MLTAVTGPSATEIAYGMGRLGIRPAVFDPSDSDLIDLMERTGPLGLVHLGADEPKNMLALAEQCRELGLDFSADPTGLEGGEAADLIDGATLLVASGESYRALQGTTGLSDEEILARIRVRVTTVDHDGVEIAGHDMERHRVPAARTENRAAVGDSAGVAAAFTAGLLAGFAWGVPLRRAAEIGAQLAALALESVGAMGYAVDPADFVRRLEESFGAAAAAEAAAYLTPA